MAPGDQRQNTSGTLVEDEPLVRLCAVGTIEAAGYEVIEAANADEAIRDIGEPATTSGLYSPTFTCPARWMG